MDVRCLFMAAVLVLIAQADHHEPAPSPTPTSNSLTGCIATEDQLRAAVNGSTGGLLSEVIVNCLAYQDQQKTVELAVVSGYSSNGDGSRYTVQCRSGLLLLEQSLMNATNETRACHQCVDTSELCLGECVNGCVSCYGSSQSQCLICEHARYNGVCVDRCPIASMSVNPGRGNECECPMYHVLPNCDCERECETRQMLTDGCECMECPNDYVLVPNYTNPVPDSVRGEPPEGEPHKPTEDECANVPHPEKRRRFVLTKRQHGEEGGHGVVEKEPAVCQQQCPDLQHYQINRDTQECYACGVQYCLECFVNNTCFRCREGTLLTDGHCEGFYTVMEERVLEIECEELREENDRDRELLELKIILPIVCVGTLVVFLGLAVITHFRYPHVGEKKRHRKPNKQTDIPEHERQWRPQATVRFR